MSLVYVERERELKVSIRSKDKKVYDLPSFSATQMRNVMLASFEAFEHLGVVGHSKDDKRPGRHIYIDRGSPVLGVAHLDSVQDKNYFWINGQFIQSPAIDNRLGAWILLHGLPSMGIYPDVLLTENEEKGQSTGADFTSPDPRWNWMFMFDRKNTDAVLYRYGGGELEDAVKEAGFSIGLGSYSCISSMGHIGIEAVNVGNGMKDYHSRRAYASLDDIESQLVKFAALYRKIEQTKFTYVPRPEPVWTPSSYTRLHARLPEYDREAWWSDEYWLAHEAQGKRKNKRKGKDSLIMRRARRMSDRLLDEARALDEVYQLGLQDFLEGEVHIGDWIEIHNVPLEAEIPRDKVKTCHECDLDYMDEDMKFSHYNQKLMCRGCWLEFCDSLGLIPSAVEEAAERAAKHKKLPEPLYPIEGEDHASSTGAD